MSLLLHFLVAAALIAVLIAFRLFADRRVLQDRLRNMRPDNECEQAGCFGGCGPKIDQPGSDACAGQNQSKRSAYHAH